MALERGLIASEKTRLKPVPVGAVTMGKGFWKTRMDANLKHGIPRLLQHLEDHGVVESFGLVSGRAAGQRRGPYFSDSDLYKWMEGAAIALQSVDSPELKAKLDGIIDEVVAAQGADGYLNTFFAGPLADQRFRNLGVEHELYCAGHLFQAAVAHYRGTGESKLLDCACRYADYLAGYFGYNKHQGVDGHPEVEMALVELYRTTGKQSYLELAEYFLSQYRFKDKQGVDGHAVRAMYLCCGGADYFVETGDSAYGEAVTRLWNDLTLRKMYITGGVGSYYAGEAIGWAYDLPNERAYAETCAAIASAMFSYRMLQIRGESKYADEMERAFYNGVISGVSLDGMAYFYMNPLACYRDYQRQEWFDCTCCPTNMVRTLAAIPGYMYSTSDEGVWVHLFDNSEVKWQLVDGTPFTLKVETKYPWGATNAEAQPPHTDKSTKITIELESPKEFTLFVRKPGWGGADMGCNDEQGCNRFENGYVGIRRVWKSGDRVDVYLTMPPRLVQSDLRVAQNFGRVAVQRGPLIYCAESTDNPDVSMRDMELKSDAFEMNFEPDILGGVVTLKGACRAPLATAPADRGPLYFARRSEPVPGLHPAPIKLIPYYAWANRGRSHMAVWMPFR